MGLVNLFKSFTRGQENAQDQLNKNFTDIEKYIDDTGWIELTMTSNFKPYQDGGSPKIRRIGKKIFIRGDLSPTRTILANEVVIIATVPEGFQPLNSRVETRQGTGKNTWLFEVKPDGSMTFSRYGKTDYTDAATTVWLSLYIEYPIG